MIPGDEPETTEFGLVLCRDAVRDELWEKTVRYLVIDDAGSCISKRRHIEVVRKDYIDILPLWVEKEGDFEVAGVTYYAKISWRLDHVTSCYRGPRREWDCTYTVFEE